jgi:hypothetical protein
MIAAFCERIGLPALDILISKFHGRVLHGIKVDLISLTTIRGVKGFTARLLYTSGLHSVEEVASAEPADIHAALVKGKQPGTGGGEWRQARSISKNARRMVKVRCFWPVLLLMLSRLCMQQQDIGSGCTHNVLLREQQSAPFFCDGLLPEECKSLTRSKSSIVCTGMSGSCASRVPLVADFKVSPASVAPSHLPPW